MIVRGYTYILKYITSAGSSIRDVYKLFHLVLNQVRRKIIIRVRYKINYSIHVVCIMLPYVLCIMLPYPFLVFLAVVSCRR